MANAFSTLVGVPVAWLLVTIIDHLVDYCLGDVRLYVHWPPQGSVLERLWSVLVYVSWVPSYDEPPWFIPTAAALLLVPCFYASILLERWICLIIWKNHDRTMIRRGVFRANLASYAFLFVAACGWLLFEIHSHSL